MPRQVFVSGSLSIADDGSLSGSLSLSGGPTPAADTPAADTPAPAGPDTVSDTVPDVPPHAPPDAGDVAGPDTGGTPPTDTGPTDTGPTDTSPAGDPGQPADPTTAGAEAGTTTDTTTTTTGGPSGDPSYVPYPGHELRRDDAQHTPDPYVRAFQQAAVDHGFTVGPVDGFFGPRTENGARAVQAAAGLDTTGVVDAATWAAVWAARA